ncbi:hypothetical protein CJD36_017920 [Flavipsychrobacter stenotrophus]|uniref:VWA domain-containing protein n=1 Tax=Flavipsychrobacter stenotrophus TaxID=2077091 RepID=A0A2S7SSB9_9BACT|nr:hypothetical protein [Flavipsychrobacter stenotrophus]PQJ09803.1 hypothetical protein CJD36_017920 [Flavipsychrobacter stenotrophus]
MQWFYWLIAALLSVGAAYWVYLSDKRRAVPYPWLTSLLRGLVVFFTILLILVPAITITQNTIEKPVVLLLQDNSTSVGVALGADSANYRKNTEQLLQKLSDKYKVVKWGFGGSVQADSPFQYKQTATDIAAAITGAQEYYGLQNLGAVILASDGRFNQGANPLFQQIPIHASLYSVAIGDSAAQKDMRVAQVYANKVVTLNTSFEIRADIVAQLCKGYNNTISLKEGNATLSTAPLVVNTDKFDRSVAYTIKADKPGLHHYVISAPEVEGEKNTANNHRDIFIEVVDEKKNILIASASPHPDVNAIKEALAGIESYNITVCTADNFPASLSGYNVIILHGLPSLRNDISRQLIAAKKPMWLILGGQTSLAAVNALKDLTFTAITSGPSHDVLATYNTSFNTFTLPQQVQSVTDKMPPLTLAIGNVMNAPGTNALFTQRSGAGDGTTPIWMMQQGAVPVAILAGEGLWRWRLYEFKNFNSHVVIDECIRQTVAFLSAGNNEKQFAASLPKYVWRDQEPIALSARLLNANNEHVNSPDAAVTIIDSAGRKRDYTFERSGNNYALNIGVWAGGTYTYRAHATYNGKELVSNGSFAVETTPVESMEQGADYPLLYGLSKKYNGVFIPSSAIGVLYDSITHNQSIKPLIRVNTEIVPFIDRKWYFFIILIIVVAEWLLRKYWLAQ